MSPAKRAEYIRDRQRAGSLYRTKSGSVCRIARSLGRPTTTVDHMITGQGEPEWFQEALQDYIMDGQLVRAIKLPGNKSFERYHLDNGGTITIAKKLGIIRRLTPDGRLDKIIMEFKRAGL